MATEQSPASPPSPTPVSPESEEATPTTPLADSEPEELGVTFAARPPWKALRSPRVTWLRGSLTVGIVLLTVLLLLMATGSLPSLTGLLPHVNSPTSRASLPTIHGHAVLQLPAATLESISSPQAGSISLFLNYVVDPSQPAHLFACGNSWTKSNEVASPAPLSIWQTENAGQSWKILPFPPIKSSGCTISIGIGAPNTLLLESDSPTSPTSPMTACTNQHYYLSDDLGQHWQAILHRTIAPAGAGGYCGAWVTQKYLFIETSYMIGNPTTPGETVETLERSADLGADWQHTVAPFQQSLRPQIVDIIQGSDGTTLLAEVVNLPTSPADVQQEPQLWMSRDAGASWNLQETIPDAGAFHLHAPPFVTAPDWLYVAAGDEIPAWFFGLQVIIRGTKQPWALLPPLPVPGANAEHSGLLQALGVLPDGRLLALGVDPGSGIPATNLAQPPAAALWLWEPTSQRWEHLAVAGLPPAWAEQCSSLCWYAQVSSGVGADGTPDTYLYFLDLTEAEQHPYRVLIP